MKNGKKSLEGKSWPRIGENGKSPLNLDTLILRQCII